MQRTVVDVNTDSEMMVWKGRPWEHILRRAQRQLASLIRPILETE